MFDLVADLRAMGATNPLRERSRRPASRALPFGAAEIYARRHADADRRLRATFEIDLRLGLGTYPTSGKPLAPGSAQVRLADALKTHEYALGRADEAVKRGTRRRVRSVSRRS